MLQVNTIDINTVVFHELVGDWSQDIHLCSYNDDTVLCDILFKTVNEEFANAFDGGSARDHLNASYPGVVDWQQLFEDLIALHKGWPLNYSVVHTPFKDLPAHYKDYIVTSKRTELFDLEMRLNFDDHYEMINAHQTIPYPDLYEEFKIPIIQVRGEKAYLAIKDKLPKRFTDRIDALRASGAELRKIDYNDTDEEIIITLCK